MNMASGNLLTLLIGIFKAQGTEISADWDQKISKLEETSRFRTLNGTKTHNQACVMLTSSDSETFRPRSNLLEQHQNLALSQ